MAVVVSNRTLTVHEADHSRQVSYCPGACSTRLQGSLLGNAGHVQPQGTDAEGPRGENADGAAHRPRHFWPSQSHFCGTRLQV